MRSPCSEISAIVISHAQLAGHEPVSGDMVLLVERPKTPCLLAFDNSFHLIRLCGDDVPAAFGDRLPPTSMDIVAALRAISIWMLSARINSIGQGRAGQPRRLIIAAPSVHCGIASAMAIAVLASGSKSKEREDMLSAAKRAGAGSEPNVHALSIIDGLLGFSGGLLSAFSDPASKPGQIPQARILRFPRG